MRKLLKKSKGFTLVELLIVIALIAILSVAVLATINPIEQANKAKDSTVQNDAAEVMNSYERYYANSQSYPWMKYGATKATVEDAILLRSDTLGFGVCDAGSTASEPSATSTQCTAETTDPGLLIKTDELKSAFAAKDEFVEVGTNDENGLWLYKAPSSGGSIYVCYVPKAKSNRDETINKLYCLKEASGSDGPLKLSPGTDCAVPDLTADDWGDPSAAITDGNIAIFKCVP